MKTAVGLLLMLLGAVAAYAPSSHGRGVPVARHGRARTLHMEMERTYIMIKPDGVQRALIGEIISRFEKRGYKMGGMKLFAASEGLLRKHYSDLTEKKFFPDMLEYMLSGPVCCMVRDGATARSAKSQWVAVLLAPLTALRCACRRCGRERTSSRWGGR